MELVQVEMDRFCILKKADGLLIYKYVLGNIFHPGDFMLKRKGHFLMYPIAYQGRKVPVQIIS